MIKKNEIYRLTELCTELEVTKHQRENRLDDLLEWLTNFYDYDFIRGGNGAPHMIQINEIYGDYQPLPRKMPSQTELNYEKMKDYEIFTIAALGAEFKPNSKARIARQAIQSFGSSKYHHTNSEAVAKRYIKKPFEEHGETNNQWCWVWYDTYIKLSSEEELEWRSILRQEEIAEDQAANAFYKKAEGESIEAELNKYQKAKDRMQDKFGDFPVRVRQWKAKEAAA